MEYAQKFLTNTFHGRSIYGEMMLNDLFLESFKKYLFQEVLQ